jgi:hypothetical protein
MVVSAAQYSAVLGLPWKTDFPRAVFSLSRILTAGEFDEFIAATQRNHPDHVDVEWTTELVDHDV